MADSLHNAFEIRHHLLVCETQNVETFGCKEGIARSIRLLLFFEVVGPAIELDNQLDREASEVRDVIPKRDLTPEAKSVNPISLEIAPQQRFGARHRLTKLLRAIALTLADGRVRHL